MGSFGPAFLQALAGNVPGSPTSPVGVVPPENGMTEAVMGFPSVARGFTGPGPVPAAPPGFDGGADESGAIAGGMGPEAEAIIRGFKPKKISFWGALGDQLLKHWGNDPAFSKRIEQKNLRRAMEGFTQDPTESIRRISQIPGYEGKAWDLLNQIRDNERASGTLERQNRALDLQNERIMYDRVAGMMNVASPDTWAKMREQAIKIGQARGVDVSHLIPEQYDPNSVEFIRYGTFKPKDYVAAQDRSRGLDIRESDTESKIERRSAQTAQGERRQDFEEVKEEGRNVRHSTPRLKSGSINEQSVLQDGSRIMYGGPDKRTAKTAIMYRPDGTKRYLNKLPNGKWREVSPPKKDE